MAYMTQSISNTLQLTPASMYDGIATHIYYNVHTEFESPGQVLIDELDKWKSRSISYTWDIFISEYGLGDWDYTPTGPRTIDITETVGDIAALEGIINNYSAYITQRLWYTTYCPLSDGDYCLPFDNLRLFTSSSGGTLSAVGTEWVNVNK